jgi:hypothetical protein
MLCPAHIFLCVKNKPIFYHTTITHYALRILLLAQDGAGGAAGYFVDLYFSRWYGCV